MFTSNNASVWLKADTLSGLTNNAPVSIWPDSSGSGEDATQNDSGHRAFYATNAINGYPAVHFDGTSSYFYISNFMGEATQAEAFVVLNVATNAAASRSSLWKIGSDPGWDGGISRYLCIDANGNSVKASQAIHPSGISQQFYRL